MTSTVKVMVGRDGRNLLGEGRARLLELVESTGSLRKAASEMGMSYRYAWGVIKRLEGAFGFPLVASERGGSTGGGTVLTVKGRELLEEYRGARSAAVSAAEGGLVKVTVVLILKGPDERVAVVDGRLPRGGVTCRDMPDTVLERLLSRTGRNAELSPCPNIRSDGTEGLLLIYRGKLNGTLKDGLRPNDLHPEDRELMRA